MPKKSCFALWLVIQVFTCHASNVDNISKAGDYLQLALPAAGLALGIINDDKEGLIQFAKAGMSTLLTVQTLKHTVARERPNGNDNLSFPSGHAAAAFAGATYIHKRYQPSYSWFTYLLAGFVGYSRVVSDNHYVSDVIAGAGIAYGFNEYFVTQAKLTVVPLINDQSVEVITLMEF